LAVELGVADRVEFRGPVPHDRVPALLRSADAVACVPWYEPFGIVALEAMACGVPVVATAVGGLMETVVDGVSGLLVPPMAPEALAASLRALLDDDALRSRLSAGGRARVVARFTWRRAAESLVDLYERILTDPVDAVPCGQTTAMP
jgi:glycosyltransferase involved in cell wall biosynthesis